MTHARRSTRLALAALPLAAAALAVTMANAPSAAATDGSVFTFPRLGTVVVNGVVDTEANFTVYRILDTTCTGTTFPGPDNSCVPQKATDTLVIPAGTYDHKTFRLKQIPDCGPTQQDVYEGQYQPTVTASGTHNYLAGSILQLGQCASVSPTSSSSAPTSTPSATDTPSANNTTPGSTVTTSASAPVGTASSSSSVLAVTGQSNPNFDTSSAVPVAFGSQLASTGTDHTTGLLVVGAAAVMIGGATLAAGRRNPSSRNH